MRHTGVVVEISPKNKVIIMTAQGEFVKVPLKKQVQVGQEIRYTPRKERLNVWQLGLAATLFLALLGTWPLISENLLPASAVPAFIITLDLNPSLELQVSAEQRILAIEGLNRDGQQLASQLKVVGNNLDEALSDIALQAERNGFIRQGQVHVTIASSQEQDITFTGKPSSGETDLEQLILDAFSTTRLADVRIWQVPRSLQTEAKLAGIVPSRYIAIQMPSTPVIPQRAETRLTMNEPVEFEEAATPLVRTSMSESVSGQERPALTPSRWTKQTAETVRTTGFSKVSFPMATVKGDF